MAGALKTTGSGEVLSIAICYGDEVKSHLDALHYDPVNVSRILVASMVAFLDHSFRREELMIEQLLD